MSIFNEWASLLDEVDITRVKDFSAEANEFSK
jgi:hypothetical protein